jgi:hypothetical protein
MTVTVKHTMFWDVKPSSPVEVCQANGKLSGPNACLAYLLTLKMEAISSSKMFVIYKLHDIIAVHCKQPIVMIVN